MKLVSSAQHLSISYRLTHTLTRPPDKSVIELLIFFYFSTKTYVVGTQMNDLETVSLRWFL